jgi:hypothetical protein
MHRFLGVAAMATALAAVSPARVQASPVARLIDLSPEACRQDLRHAALGGSIEGRCAGAAGPLAFLMLDPGPLPAPAFTPLLADADGSPASAPLRTPAIGRAAAPPAPGVFSTSAILAISSAQVYPNPFNPAFTNTTIEYTLSKDARVEITAYDWTGAFVDRIYAGPGSAGGNTQEWGGQTEDGQKLGNGVYLIRIVAVTDARTESQVLKAVVWNDG